MADVTSSQAVSTAPQTPATADGARPARRTTAEAMAKKQREISISEFFAKNRHLLGFDNARKALLTTVKEAVDNSLDACEEAGILPSVTVRLSQSAEDRFRVLVRDNGPGIVEKNIKNVFGKLLYGSKFHRLRMSRGQQGIGISAAGMYGLMTTGKSVVIISRTSAKKPAHYCELQIDTKHNEAQILKSHDCDEEELRKLLKLRPDETFEHGTQVEIELKAAYIKGRQSVDAYIEQTAIANPHAEFHYSPPSGEVTVFPRASQELPPEPTEIKPHPYGIELGTLLKFVKETEHGSLGRFLEESFSRVSNGIAKEICEAAKLGYRTHPRELDHRQIEALFAAMQAAKVPPPPTDCLVPIGIKAIQRGLLKEIKADVYFAESRKPAVYRGNPFLVEVGLAFGGELGQFIGKDDIPTIDADVEDKTRKKKKGDDEPTPTQARLIRFANRVPLQYQQGACCTFKAMVETKWSGYGVPQSRGNLPNAPMVLMIHVASVWVPFTSESKEAIADYDEIRREIKLALQTVGRKLSAFINRRNRIRREDERRSVFHRYINEVVAAAKKLDPDLDPDKLRAQLIDMAKKKTELVDATLDDEGRVVRADGDDLALEHDEGTLIVRDVDGRETDAAKLAAQVRGQAGAEDRSSSKPAELPLSGDALESVERAQDGEPPPPATKTKRSKSAGGGLFDDAA